MKTMQYQMVKDQNSGTLYSATLDIATVNSATSKSAT